MGPSRIPPQPRTHSPNRFPDPGRPMLREDLVLLPGPPGPKGLETWTLHDPVRHAFFRIGVREFNLLSHWEKPDRELLEILNRETAFKVSQKDIDRLSRFLAANHLLRPDHPAVSQSLRLKAASIEKLSLGQALARSLFFRIPVARPDRFLSGTLKPVQRLLPLVKLLALPALVLALYILLRQWAAFIHTLGYFFSIKGMVLYGMAILAAKLAHELGHAYAAKHYGLHVPTMGVALMLFWPIFYTDTTEAWRIRERRPRMIMAAAGMGVELGIAVLATLAWALLADGPGRSACFILASATWIKSLAFNGLPFLRFDGYYLLSDFLEIPNLMGRAFGLGRWYLRKSLLGIDQPCPENLPPGRCRFLVLFAFTTWIYRISLFTGIALTVYHFCFKALGILLFSVEIFWFLGRPVWREIRSWPRLIGQAGMTRQNLLFLIFLAGLVLLAVLPMGRTIRVPGLAWQGKGYQIYPPAGSRITAVHVASGQRVEKGQPLFDLASPDLAHQITLTQSRIRVMEAQIRRQNASRELREQGGIARRQLAEARTALAGFQAREGQLHIRAQVDGIILDMPDGLIPGRWVNPGRQLALLVDDSQPRIEALVPEADLGRIREGGRGRFYPDIPESAMVDAVTVLIEKTNVGQLKTPYMASVFGGPVPVVPMGQTLAVRQSLYRLLMAPAAANAALPPGISPGTLVLDARPRPWIQGLIRRLATLGIRESGF